MEDRFQNKNRLNQSELEEGLQEGWWSSDCSEFSDDDDLDYLNESWSEADDSDEETDEEEIDEEYEEENDDENNQSAVVNTDWVEQPNKRRRFGESLGGVSNSIGDNASVPGTSEAVEPEDTSISEPLEPEVPSEAASFTDEPSGGRGRGTQAGAGVHRPGNIGTAGGGRAPRGRGRGASRTREWTWTDGNNFEPRHFPFLDEEIAGCAHRDLNPDSKLTDFFYKFFPEELVERIIECSNKYMWFRRGGKVEKKGQRWWGPDITVKEFYVFLALCILKGVVKKRDLQSYWSTDPLIQTPFWSKVMPRDRFLFILSSLHFYEHINPALRVPDLERDRMRRIRMVFDSLRELFKKSYNPSKNLVIDESLVLWRGNIVFRMYIPSKRHRFGFKIYVLCDCKSGYVLDIILYTGEQTEIGETASLGVSGAVVVELMKGYLGRGHTLYVDNWYTSPLLSEELLKHNTHLCGTVKRNRKHVPKLVGKLKTGDILYKQQEEKKIMVTTWQDRREVNILSTAHKPGVKEVHRRRRGEQTTQVKPEVVIEYTKNMRLVDKSDGMIASIECARKTQKWYKKLFLHLVDMAVLNSQILYNEVELNSKMTLPMFAKELVRQLIRENYETMPRQNQTASMGHVRLNRDKDHLPRKYDGKKRRKCHLCNYSSTNPNTRSDTPYYCITCNQALCIGDRDRNCFHIYHKQVNCIKCRCCSGLQQENIPPL